eukprot:719131_1
MAPDEQLSMYCSKLSIPERLGPVVPIDGRFIFQATQNFVGKTVYLNYLSKSGLSVKPAFVQPEYAENLPSKERHDVEGAFNNNADHDEPGQHDNYSNEKLPSYEEALTRGSVQPQDERPPTCDSSTRKADKGHKAKGDITDFVDKTKQFFVEFFGPQWHTGHKALFWLLWLWYFKNVAFPSFESLFRSFTLDFS